MKQREVSKGLIVVGASSDVFADVLSDLSSEQRETMLASWPGPNTWLVPHKGFFPSWITGDSDEVAIRVTSSPALATLCAAFGGPLVSTSANPAGLPPPHSIWELRRYFGMSCDPFDEGAVLDVDEAARGLACKGLIVVGAAVATCSLMCSPVIRARENAGILARAQYLAGAPQGFFPILDNTSGNAGRY